MTQHRPAMPSRLCASCRATGVRRHGEGPQAHGDAVPGAVQGFECRISPLSRARISSSYTCARVFVDALARSANAGYS